MIAELLTDVCLESSNCSFFLRLASRFVRFDLYHVLLRFFVSSWSAFLDAKEDGIHSRSEGSVRHGLFHVGGNHRFGDR